MTADEKLSRIRVKVERANKHINEAEVEVGRFKNSRPYVLRAERNLQTTAPVYYVKSMLPIPVDIACIAADALNNLRTALDQLMCNLFVIATREEPEKLYFPIRDTADDFLDALHGREIRRLRHDTLEAIKNVHPYKGGNDHIWILNKLNNRDKHRMLLTVACAHVGYGVPPGVRKAFQSSLFRQVDTLYISANHPQRVLDMKEGTELFSDLPNAEIDDNIDVAFEVAFNEPGIVEGKNVVGALRQLSQTVDSVLLGFRDFLA